MYERFYGFKARPFQLMPDPRLLFESRNHTRALSYLLYGLERHEGFVVVTGDVGTGKTLLLQTMLSQLQSRHLSIARVAMANVNAESVLPSVAAAFGVAYKGRSKFELLDALVAKLVPGRTRGSLLIVDEAQACSLEALEELRVISNLQANGQALVQVFLIGQTELRGLLSRPSMAHLRQRIVASHHLEPLDRDEVAGYIEHRLDCVGRQDKPTFGDGVYSRVHDWSGGIPRRINLIMDRFLLFGYLEERTDLTMDDLETVISEFETEFSDDKLALDDSHVVTAPAVSGRTDASLGLLTDRIAGLEHALRGAMGDARAEELLKRHQADSEQKELIETLLRIDRLESAFAEFRRGQRRTETFDTEAPEQETRRHIETSDKTPDKTPDKTHDKTPDTPEPEQEIQQPVETDDTPEPAEENQPDFGYADPPEPAPAIKPQRPAADILEEQISWAAAARADKRDHSSRKRFFHWSRKEYD